MKKYITLMCIIVTLNSNYSQNLKKGFDREEYKDLLKLTIRTNIDTLTNTLYGKTYPLPVNYKKVYRSSVVGLDNLWELWKRKDSKRVAVLSIRGTTSKTESWLDNLYAAMVPAKGEIQIDEDEIFCYDLANSYRASVHTGWLISLSSMAPEMEKHILKIYDQGYKDLIIIGHSQGGAITYLLTSYLYRKIEKGELPADINIKTYSSGAPKPGNIYFAYEYEYKTRRLGSYTVVNSQDWVPQSPISIEAFSDFNKTNPFKTAKKEIKKIDFPENILLGYAYIELKNSLNKAKSNYIKILGDNLSKYVKKYLPGFKIPEFSNTYDYVRTGIPIILFPDDNYFEKFKDVSDNIFTHHLGDSYFYLIDIRGY